MRRYKLICALVTVLLLLALFVCARAEDDPHGEGVFKLPKSLLIIEESAFERTAPITVYLAGSVESIGDRAFADVYDLQAIYIPPTTRYIGRNAFEGARRLTIYGVPYSYADIWARIHLFRFLYADIWGNALKTSPVRANVGEYIGSADRNTPDAAARLKCKSVSDECTVLRVNPRDNPEMYPLDYDFP